MRSLRYILLFAVIIQLNYLHAQEANNTIAKANEAYKQQQYDKAIELYHEALKSSPGNPVAGFNLGNALFRNKKYDEAVKAFEETSRHESPAIPPGKIYYNKGVSFTAQKKLQESIDAYKQALRLNASDTLARENLQRALNEQKRQQEQDDQKKQQKQQKEDKPKPNPSKLNQQQVQQLLKALEEQEKKLQEKMMRKTPTTGQPDKDW